jgi:hypothetical protein
MYRYIGAEIPYPSLRDSSESTQEFVMKQANETLTIVFLQSNLAHTNSVATQIGTIPLVMPPSNWRFDQLTSVNLL